MAEKKSKKQEKENKEVEKETLEEAAETVKEALGEESKKETPVEEIVKEEAQPAAYAELFSKYVRLQADFENYKKRNRDTAKVMYDEGVADAIEGILPTLDNLEMAILSQKDESFRQGLELVKKAFLDALAKFGVEEIDALGKEFDPNIHEAVMNKDDPENAGKVVQVLKKGYIRNGKVLRHPLVVVGQ